MAEYSNAVNYFVDSSRVFINQNTHSAIVLHGTGGSATQTALQLGDYFRSTVLMTSVHYGIDRTGVVCQYVSEADGAGGNCCLEVGHDPFWDQFNGDNLNIHTLSIEHVNDLTNSLALTNSQKAASFKLIAHLSQKYTIPFSHIKSHASLMPQSRALCPGPAFPWTDLANFIQNGGNVVTPPNKWQIADAEAEWKCTANLFPGDVAPVYTTGIAKAWTLRIYQGQRIGPPITGEYSSTDWGGNALKVQQFTNARCEWRVDGSSCRFFGPDGEIV